MPAFLYPRRMFIKNLFCFSLGVACFSTANVFGAEGKSTQKPLVVYFSHSGHTKKIAEMIHNKVGGDIVEIQTQKPYPEKYDALTKYAKDELAAQSMPPLKSQIPNLDDYSIVFLGFPNWWSSVPMPVHTFARDSRLNGKMVAPFLTHGGGGKGHTEADLKKMLPDSRLSETLSISGSRVDSAENEVTRWLSSLGLQNAPSGNSAAAPAAAK